MANKMRWIRGDRNEVKVSVDSATVIEVGDILWLDVDDAKPASQQDDQGSEGANQQLLHDVFLGVAMEPHPAGSGIYNIRIATSGVFRFDCLGAARNIGDLMSSDEDSGGTFLQNQVVVKVSNVNAAIGSLVDSTASTKLTADVEIYSSILRGGSQAIA